MKHITDKDLQQLYDEAPQILYDHVRQKLSLLQEKKQEAAIIKKRYSARLIAAAIVLIGLMTIALATGTVQKWLYVNRDNTVIEIREEATANPSLPDSDYGKNPYRLPGTIT